MAAKTIEHAFRDDTDLAIRVANAYTRCKDDAELSQVFIDIATFVVQHQKKAAVHKDVVVSEPHPKKRKLDTNEHVDGPPSESIADPMLEFECNDISFTMPMRKKLRLSLVAERSSHASNGQIQLRDMKTDNLEHALSLGKVGYVFNLVVPDKAQKQQCFIILPKDGGPEIVFTVNDVEDKAGAVTKRLGSHCAGETLSDVISRSLGDFLQQNGMATCLPSADYFASCVPQPHRKGEKAYHVKAFRGSKEGYLFFLGPGILFGFKKPILFFSLSDIASISYTSVLQRTFNLVITSNTDDAQETEFSMLDQIDFSGIDEYIKSFGLNDASMAVEKRAKVYNVNKAPKAGNTNGHDAEVDDNDGQTELQRAEQQLQDEEDELEEDYDPSGGESDGEGEESEVAEEAGDHDEGYDDAVDEDADDDDVDDDVDADVEARQE